MNASCSPLYLQLARKPCQNWDVVMDEAAGSESESFRHEASKAPPWDASGEKILHDLRQAHRTRGTLRVGDWDSFRKRRFNRRQGESRAHLPLLELLQPTG